MPRTTTPISKLPSGKYRVRFRDGDGRQRKAAFATCREALAFLESTKVAVRQGTYVSADRGRQKLSAFIDEWVAVQD